MEGARGRLVHVTTTDISLALLLRPQLEAFAAAGYEVIGMSAAGEWVDDLEAAGIRHVALGHATRSWSIGADIRAFVEMWRAFRRLRPDIVHTHNPKPGVYGRVAARLARVPVVVNTQHGLFAQPSDRWAKRAAVYALERFAVMFSDAELVQSIEDLDTLARLRIAKRRLTLLGNGIDLDRFDPSSISERERAAARAELGAGAGDVVVGTVARLVREKGIPDVIDAAAELRRTHPSARFVVIGPREPDKADGLTDEEIAHAEELGVRFLGTRRDMPRLYAAMDLVVFPSRREGFPRVPMEAAAIGVPVVAYDVRGSREAVDHDVTGLLVPCGDPAALAGAVRELVDDPGRRRRLGDAAVERARRCFDQRTVIDQTLVTYDRLRSRRTARLP